MPSHLCYIVESLPSDCPDYVARKIILSVMLLILSLPLSSELTFYFLVKHVRAFEKIFKHIEKVVMHAKRFRIFLYGSYRNTNSD